MNKTKIEAIIFDMDGVIINTETILDKDEFDLLKKLTKNRWSKQDQRSIHGLSIESEFELLKSRFYLSIPKEDFLAKYHALLQQTYQNKVVLNPGIVELLNRLQEKYKIALASSTSHKFIKMVLQRFNLTKYFPVIVSGDDLDGKSKPDPQIFLLAAQKLKTNPNHCLVVEDSLNGIKAAKNAGMLCIVYTANNILNSEGVKLTDLKIENFQELKLL